MITAEYFATITKGKIDGWTEATPPHELTQNQIPLTKEELQLLRACWGNLSKAKQLIKSIERKINELGE